MENRVISNITKNENPLKEVDETVVIWYKISKNNECKFNINKTIYANYTKI